MRMCLQIILVLEHEMLFGLRAVKVETSWEAAKAFKHPLRIGIICSRSISSIYFGSINPQSIDYMLTNPKLLIANRNCRFIL